MVALAGRRIDRPDAKEIRFPLAAAAAVGRALTACFRDEHAVVLVASAACGADLLALEAARSLGLRTRIVLPFGARAFRGTSVTDRPGDWGPRFDEEIADALARDDIVELDGSPADPDPAYAAATQRIVDEAAILAPTLGAEPIAVAVWECRRRPGVDATQDFLARATRARFRTLSVPTLAG